MRLEFASLYRPLKNDRHRESGTPGKRVGVLKGRMDRIQELIEVLSDKQVQARDLNAKTSHTCKICGTPAEHFLSASSEFEYQVSHICQDCQNYYYLFDQ